MGCAYNCSKPTPIERTGERKWKREREREKGLFWHDLAPQQRLVVSTTHVLRTGTSYPSITAGEGGRHSPVVRATRKKRERVEKGKKKGDGRNISFSRPSVGLVAHKGERGGGGTDIGSERKRREKGRERERELLCGLADGFTASGGFWRLISWRHRYIVFVALSAVTVSGTVPSFLVGPTTHRIAVVLRALRTVRRG